MTLRFESSGRTSGKRRKSLKRDLGAFTPELSSVIGCPFKERLWRCSCDLCDCGCNVRRLADRGSPGLEQHIYGGQRPNPEQLMPCLVWRDFFDAQRAANHATDCGHLLELAQGLRPS